MLLKQSSFLILFVLFCFSVMSQNQTQLNNKDDLGRKQGYWKSFDEMGYLKYEGTFKNDIPIDTFKYYYPDGKLRALSVFYNEGKKSYAKLFHRNEKLMAEGNYLNQKKDSVWRYYSEYDGVLLSEEIYINNQKNGLWRQFFPNGNVAEELNYKNDVEDGEWKQFYTDGTKKLEGFYVRGLKEGLIQMFYPNGQVETSGNYLNSLKEGIWKSFSEDGKVNKEEYYQNGKLKI
ncbi:MAG: toxin-antitoxin system YwqK family antitoxin [Bacteroidetes bacterium]|nr:toxin-antitoxin system YwqK family antitoxin [Bacteroidota bacterium]